MQAVVHASHQLGTTAASSLRCRARMMTSSFSSSVLRPLAQLQCHTFTRAMHKSSKSQFHIRASRRLESSPPGVVSAATAVQSIKNGDLVFLHSVAACPSALVSAMSDRHAELSDIKVTHIHTEGDLPYLAHPSVFRDVSFFVGANTRASVAAGDADFVPIFLSEVPSMFASTHFPLDVALISVSPPDKHGYCSLGPSVDVSLSAVVHATTVIAQVNRHMPRTHGDGIIHVSNIDFIVEDDKPLPTLKVPTIDDVTARIGKNVAALVEDGSCLQMGIGSIPDATLSFLTNHRDLGIHTEMFSEGVIELYESGVITNRYKSVTPGVITASFLYGSQKLYDFVDDNPGVILLPSDFVNSPSIIKQNSKVVAINSAIEIDITGQVCADSIGDRIYSGIGGQMDFERGAKLSRGGVPIIALPSRTSHGVSRIVPRLKHGAGVVTTRAHVHWVVTEWGAVNLFGKTMHQRGRLLMSVAHPDDREPLERYMHAMYGGNQYSFTGHSHGGGFHMPNVGPGEEVPLG